MQGKLPPHREAKLDAITFSWNTEDFWWNKKFEQLKAYKKDHGDFCVPYRWKDDHGLWFWINRQKTDRKMGKLPADRQKKLDSIGFTWDIKEGN